MTQYTESGACTIKWEADQFDNVRLTNSKGHTFTAKSEELHDFISYEDDGLAKEKQSLLDDFAKAAMQGELAAQAEGYSSWIDDFEGLAEMSYDIAEAMMQERERRMKG